MRGLLTGAALLGSCFGQQTNITANAVRSNELKEQPVKSGVRMWVDPETPANRQTYRSSRGRRWDLVMSDEFNIPNRDFRPGKDHIWTSLEKPDGVNGALELYSHNMTSTACDADGTCYFYIKVVDDHQQVHVYNMYKNPPQFETVNFFYRAAMVQSWNKFCFQGGMLEVRAQLPGATSKKSKNPDIAKGENARATAGDYYPTWPGIWMMGNLGRAIFSGSTSRMWPFSYDRCEPDVFNPKYQRISACESNPGFGLNPNQGRGAPEIDLLEGGGTLISSSLQIGPGMPTDFRIVSPTNEDPGCKYQSICNTIGANHMGVPSDFYDKRRHKSWYQGLRYSSNPFCSPDPTQQQKYETVARAVKAGIKDNFCTKETCPASRDAYSDLNLIDGNGTRHWGINYDGTCFPMANVYTGAYLCDPNNQNKLCASPRPDDQPITDVMKPFNYQMDAISSNWPVHVGAYTNYVVYQIEWVTGRNGYVRWMLEGHPIFEVTADTIENVPQDEKKTNPRKIMLEEPMYLIMNIAVARDWGARPIFTDMPCRGDGTNENATRICDEYPMFMKIDYIRLYQDLGEDRDPDNYMQLGCDPASHPTKKWINAHLDEYEDYDNPAIDVAGGALCTKNDDCTILRTGKLEFIQLTTGACVKKRCVCSHPKSWGGPRCTVAMNEAILDGSPILKGYGPPLELALAVAGIVVVLTSITLATSLRRSNVHLQLAAKAVAQKNVRGTGESPLQQRETHSKWNYSNNFV